MKFEAKNIEEFFKEVRDYNRETPTKLMICTPAYGGMCGARYMLSLVNTVELLLDLGFEYRISVLSNNSLVPHARNALASAFMYSDFTHLMFIDADIEWGPQDVIKLWLADRDVAAGIYPKKKINWDLIERAADADKRPLADFAGEYVFNPVPGDKSGETDEFGYFAVKDKVHMHDLHATMLHLLGLDHERLTYRYAGRDFRLTDVYGEVVTGIMG